MSFKLILITIIIIINLSRINAAQEFLDYTKDHLLNCSSDYTD